LEQLTEVLKESLGRAQIVILTGGLGPTPDDITREAIANVLGVPLVEHAEIASKLRERIAKYKGHIGASALKQALLPASAKPIPNPVGSAPGILAEHEGKLLIAMPGVPAEMESMFERHVKGELERRLGERKSAIAVRILRCVGLGESALTERVSDIAKRYANVSIGSLICGGEVWLRITVMANTREEAKKLLEDVERCVRERVGEYVFGIDDEALERIVGQLLKERCLTIAVAESCTGGLVTDTLTNIPGSSSYVKGSVVAYTEDVKRALLGVRAETLSTYGAVSEQCAVEMAEGVRKLLGTDIGASVTGIAGPTGGTPEKPVGTVFIAVADERGCICRCYTFGGDRRGIKERACKALLNLIRKRLLGIA
ncbi:MAG: competence/damage-inducible protein A, partial [Armatimonadetes bacterium]|nr:competence/damage-inducible protein A [Armatimonadota bacterium]